MTRPALLLAAPARCPRCDGIADSCRACHGVAVEFVDPRCAKRKRNAIAALLACLLAACAAPTRVDAVARCESLARHTLDVLAGPRATWRDGTTAQLLLGTRQPLYGPGEPHESARAPDEEFQVAFEVSTPIFGGP